MESALKRKDVLENALDSFQGFNRGVTDCPEDAGQLSFEFDSDADVDEDCPSKASQSEFDSKQGQCSNGSISKEAPAQATRDGRYLLENHRETLIPSHTESESLTPQEAGEEKHESLPSVKNVKPAEGDACRKHGETQSLTEKEAIQPPQRFPVMKPDEGNAYKSPSLAQLATLMMQKFEVEADDDEDDQTDDDDHKGDETPDPPRRTTVMKPDEGNSYKSPSLQKLALVMQEKYAGKDDDDDDSKEEKQKDETLNLPRRTTAMKPDEGNSYKSPSLQKLALVMQEKYAGKDDDDDDSKEEKQKDETLNLPRRTTAMKPDEGNSYKSPSLQKLALVMQEKYAGNDDDDDDSEDEKQKDETLNLPRRTTAMKPDEGNSYISPSLQKLAFMMQEKYAETDDDDDDSEDDAEEEDTLNPLRRGTAMKPDEGNSYKSPRLQKLAVMMMEKYAEVDDDHDESEDDAKEDDNEADDNEKKEEQEPFRRSQVTSPHEPDRSASVDCLTSKLMQQKVQASSVQTKEPPKKARSALLSREQVILPSIHKPTNLAQSVLSM
eukprot:TRINITY_DN426_c0_g1_i1.p1 TRINITY_DN426_c0_g1~~TRINITY_DN426_c0_g1_i1.p1  ORF type:complete len:551 (-),score=138.40 TRINITY_DN426_c0_g1_i1:355-2007(-)